MNTLQYVRQLQRILGKGWVVRSIDDWAYRACHKKLPARYFQMCLIDGFVLCPSGLERKRLEAPLGYKLWELSDGELSCHHAFFEREHQWKPVYPLLVADMPALLEMLQ